MPRLKRLAGRDVVAFLTGLGFEVVSQRGTHIKLRRFDPSGQKQTLTVPLHSQLDTGTCRAIVRQASAYIPDEQLRAFFYAD